MKRPVSIVLVGIGGMGSVYLAELLRNMERGLFVLSGTVDPQARRCPALPEIEALRIPVFESLEAFYSRLEADLAIIASPIQFHAAQTCLALERGSYVLCEKPAAATIQEIRAMRKAEKKTGRWVAVGYQWSFSPPIQNLKKDIRAGLFGRPERLKCLTLWPRDAAYYRRNDWAGRKSDAHGGWVLDGPAHNAMAHDLHNMFYVLGRRTETAAAPLRVEAELYHAYDIENYDTAALRCLTDSGAELLLYVSHAISVDRGPVFLYKFNEGQVEGAGKDMDIQAHSHRGYVNYGSPNVWPLKKMWDAIDLVAGRGVPVCGLEAAQSQVLCINGAQESMPEIASFPEDMRFARGESGNESTSAIGLAEALTECFERDLLPSELGFSWSRKGRLVRLDNYTHFPGGKKKNDG